LALFVFRSSAGHDIFNWISNFAKGYLGKASEGAAFLVGADIVAKGFFAISVFPAVIFFAATVQILYYIGALQWILAKSAPLFVGLLDISGCEAIVAVASVSPHCRTKEKLCFTYSTFFIASLSWVSLKMSC
jgi:CNT family concentrative nucleoside transporter